MSVIYWCTIASYSSLQMIVFKLIRVNIVRPSKSMQQLVKIILLCIRLSCDYRIPWFTISSELFGGGAWPCTGIPAPLCCCWRAVLACFNYAPAHASQLLFSLLDPFWREHWAHLYMHGVYTGPGYNHVCWKTLKQWYYYTIHRIYTFVEVWMAWVEERHRYWLQASFLPGS